MMNVGFFFDDSLPADASEGSLNDTPIPNPRSKSAKIEAASARFVDLFKRVAEARKQEKR